MRSSLEQSVFEFIRRGRLLLPGDRVGVAVSGGADSVALLLLLRALRDDLGVTLAVVHFNHSLRGDESEGDANFVFGLARKMHLDFFSDTQDVSAVARRNDWNLEDAGRRLRYAFFERLVKQDQVTRIAVAHTQDDQAETVLAHMIRGTGPTGLAGIYPAAGAVVRPLLAIRRQDLRKYLSEERQPWREDSSNQDLHRLRSRIRTNLLPLLESDFSPQIVRRLADLARLAREEETFWDQLVEHRFRACVRHRGSDWVVSIRDLVGAPLQGGYQERQSAAPAEVPWGRSLTERLIRRLYEETRGTRRGFSAQNVEDVIHLAAQSPSGCRVQLPGGVSVEKSFDDLIFSARPAPGERKCGSPASIGNGYRYEFSLQPTGTTSVSVPELGSCFHLKVVDWPSAESETKRGIEALDADLVGTILVLRSWRPGDAYRPRGRRGVRKLKDMFRIRRVPSGMRGEWPVLESSGHVIWARGMVAAADYCPSDRTRAGLLVVEERV